MNDVPAFKKFVSEDELEEQKRKRQEEWEKVRKPDEPLEAPEEEHDPRSLYDRLQEQKDKKQQEYEENYKLKNQVKGLESDEVEFLEFVSDKQSEITRAREKETETMLEEYRNAVVTQTSPEKKSVKATAGSSQLKKSQSSLLAGAVKRKGTESSTSQDTKKAKSEEGIGSSTEKVESGGQVAQIIGILPGLGAYSGSSSGSSDSSDSDDSDVDTRMFSKRQVCVEHRH